MKNHNLITVLLLLPKGFFKPLVPLSLLLMQSGPIEAQLKLNVDDDQAYLKEKWKDSMNGLRKTITAALPPSERAIKSKSSNGSGDAKSVDKIINSIKNGLRKTITAALPPSERAIKSKSSNGSEAAKSVDQIINSITFNENSEHDNLLETSSKPNNLNPTRDANIHKAFKEIINAKVSERSKVSREANIQKALEGITLVKPDIVKVPEHKNETNAEKIMNDYYGVKDDPRESLLLQSGIYEYKLSEEKMNWSSHEKKAEEWGGHLASIHSDEEWEVVKTLCNGRDCFLGGKRHENTWEWSDDSAFDYINWAPGEPNNYGNDQNVIGLYPRFQMKMDDINDGHQTMSIKGARL